MKYHFLCHSKSFGICFQRGLMLEESDFTHNFLDLLRNSTNGHKHSKEVRRMQKSGFSMSVTVHMWRATTWRWEGKSFYADLGQSKFSCFPIQILSSLAVREILSVWPSFYSSFANGCFFCFFCSPTKLIGSAWLLRFCPNVGGLTLRVHSHGLREPQTYTEVSPTAVSLLFIGANTKWIHSE